MVKTRSDTISGLLVIICLFSSWLIFSSFTRNIKKKSFHKREVRTTKKKNLVLWKVPNKWAKMSSEEQTKRAKAIVLSVGVPDRKRAIFKKNRITPAAIAYIQAYAHLAIAEYNKNGVPASITLAQGIIESKSGQSRLAKATKNHFGVKCFGRFCPHGHCFNKTDDSPKDRFLIYKSVWESYRGHSNFLTRNTRYAKCFKSKNYKEWAYRLKAAGYATKGEYPQVIIGVIERYGLDKYDVLVD